MFSRISTTIGGVFVTFLLSIVFAVAQTSGRPAPKRFVSAQDQLGQPFQDPQGRYSLSIPPGWELNMAGDDPTFRNGASWIQLRVLTASSASDAVDQATTIFRPQFTAFNTINRGNTNIAGHASHGLNIDGVTTSGQRMSVLFTAQPQGKKNYLVLVSATPLAQAAQLNTSVMELANSVRFSGE